MGLTNGPFHTLFTGHLHVLLHGLFEEVDEDGRGIVRQRPRRRRPAEKRSQDPDPVIGEDERDEEKGPEEHDACDGQHERRVQAQVIGYRARVVRYREREQWDGKTDGCVERSHVTIIEEVSCHGFIFLVFGGRFASLEDGIGRRLLEDEIIFFRGRAAEKEYEP